MPHQGSPSTAYLQTCRDALTKEQTASLAATNGWAHVDRDQVHADWDQIYRAMAQDLEQRNPDDSGTRELIGHVLAEDEVPSVREHPDQP